MKIQTPELVIVCTIFLLQLVPLGDTTMPGFFAFSRRNYDPSKIFDILPARITNAEYNSLKSTIASIELVIKSLNIRISAMQELITENGRKCPTSAIGGVVVEGICYTVETSEMSFENAQLACHNKGGIMAEPPVGTRETFYSNIKTAFPTQIGQIEGKVAEKRNPFIGLKREIAGDDDFRFISSGTPVPSDDAAVFDDAVPDDTAALQVVAILPPGTTWARITPDDTTTRSFICQYGTV